MHPSGWKPRRLALAVVLCATPGAMAQPADLDIETTFQLDASPADPGSRLALSLRVVVPGEYHFQSNEPLDEFLVPTVLKLTAPRGFTVREIVYPKPVMFDVAGEPAAVFEKEFDIGVTLEVIAAVAPGEHPFVGVLAYQACDSLLCLMPSELELRGVIEITLRDGKRTARFVEPGSAPPDIVEPGVPDVPSEPPTVPSGDCDQLDALDGFTVLAATAGIMGVDDFMAFIDAAETGKAQRGWFEDKGPIAIVLLIVLGGIALNLTPCVLPLVPINIAIIGAGAQSGSRARGFALGGTYGLAMAVVYGGLGLVVTLTTATFGAINGTIWFNVAIAILFIVLSLGMFDIVTIDFSKFQSKLDVAGAGKRGTFAVAFGMGAVTALLAGACVAPVVIQVIVYSGDQYAKGQSIALALPFFLGLGMALPWPFAGAGLSFLPKPGKWMVLVKKGMGVFILSFAAYYGYQGWLAFDSTRVDPIAVQNAVDEQLEDGWTASLCDGLATARAEDKLVLIDMWATWCKNCMVMDKTTLKDEAVLARLDDYVKVKLQSQNLRASPTKEILERFESPGLPTYAILRAK